LNAKTKTFLMIPYGQRGGGLVHVSDVDRGLACRCTCPECGQRLVARKGAKMKAHFAHHAGANCQPETAMHKLGKLLLHRRLSQAITAGEAVPISWSCASCHDQHNRNLVKHAASVHLEADLGLLRPDVLLLNAEGALAAIVEIIVTHKPDQHVLDFAATNGVPVVEFHLGTAEDLERLDQEEMLEPTRVHLCTRPKCPTCRGPMSMRTLHVVEGDCWRCKHLMKVAVIEADGSMFGPEEFTDAEVAAATQQGAILKMNYSKTVRARYLSNTCARCLSFAGSFYLHDYWELMSPDNGHALGYVCLTCAEPEQ